MRFSVYRVKTDVRNFARPFADALLSDVPETEALYPTILTLPCSTALSFEEQSKVIYAVADCVSRLA